MEFEWKDCDLRYCTFQCNGKCLNKKREECPYAEVLDISKVTIKQSATKMNIVMERPRTDDSRE
jgi:hypothetical protein